MHRVASVMLRAGRATCCVAPGATRIFMERAHESPGLARHHRYPLRHCSRSQDRGRPRRDHQSHELRDLRLGPASLRPFHARHEERRHHGPRDHGRSRRGRLRRERQAKVGERVVVPFTIICGECEQCRRGNFSVCERTNRNKELADTAFGHTTAGLFGYTHLTGGYPGGQAEYLRVPVRRRDAHQGAGRHHRREAAVPQRHFPDRLAGRGAMRHRADRHGRDLGLRPGRPDGDPQRDPAGRETGRRDRPRSRTPVDGRGRRRDHRSISRRKASSSG